MPPVIATAQQHAHGFLRHEIVAGHLPSGTRIKAEEVAARLGISRMPVREALRQLDAEGLVVIRPNRGAVVTSLTADDVVELFEMRGVLEGLAVRLGVGRIAEDELAALERLLERMRRHSDHLKWIERHNAFHERLCKASGRERLCREIIKLRSQVEPYLRLFATRHPARELVGYEHELILDAIRGGDPAHAEDVMRNHVRQNGFGIAETLARLGDGEHRPGAPAAAGGGTSFLSGRPAR